MIAAVASIICAVIAATASIYIATRAGRQAEAAGEIARTAQADVQKLRRYVYDNGTLTETEIAGAKMVVRVNGSANAGPVSVPIDMERFVQICGDADGCLLTLGATRFRQQIDGLTDESYILQVPLQGAPCRFFWDVQTRGWSLSQACIATYGLYAYAGVYPFGSYQFSRAYQVYEYGNFYGHDDSQIGSDVDTLPLNIMSFKGACFLSEAPPDRDRRGGHLLPDDPQATGTGDGLYLIASSPDWDDTGAYPKADRGGRSPWPEDDPLRQCVLIAED
ncbi:hypothetical protein [Paracoccus caeni]|nr:hypothetical protein [Paracoccus caeni]